MRKAKLNVTVVDWKKNLSIIIGLYMGHNLQIISIHSKIALLECLGRCSNLKIDQHAIYIFFHLSLQ
jgi:hypothetical protein